MENTQKVWIGRILFLVVIILISTYVLIWSGTLRCSKIPGGCGTYWGIQSTLTGKTQPSVTIFYDSQDQQALGNAEELRKILTDREVTNVHPNISDVKYLSADQLKNTSLIIVDQARKISTTNLITFMNYVQQGGRLLWIGDSGIEKTPEDSYFVNPISQKYNGWQRVTDDNVLVRFNAFLGVKYIDNFCNIKSCGEDIKTGELVSESDHPLVKGLRQNLEVYDNYSLVKSIEANPTPLKIDYGSNIIDSNNQKYGSIFPLIVTSNSGRVAYYAIPPESLCEEEDEKKYMLIIENLIDGMLN